MEKYSVLIKQIEWLDREALEADILFEIKGDQFWAFCHPCEFYKGETTAVYFDFLEEEINEAVFWSENTWQKKSIIRSDTNQERYYCFGRLTALHPVKVDCGTLSFNLGDWINDDRTIGNYVYFVIARLDIVKV